MKSLIEEPFYDIRYSDLSDEASLLEWMKDDEIRKWYPPSTFQDCLMWVKNWIGFSRFRASLTATYESNPIGIATIFLMPYVKVAHQCMMYMCVKPEFQRKKVGFSLLKNICHLATTRFQLEFMHIEVFEGCPIIPLVQKYDFYEVFRQNEFVLFDDEGYKARIVLERELKNGP